MTRHPSSRGGGDRGSVTLELTILAPAVLVLIGLAIVGGRVVLAGSAVEQAASAAAREASIARDPAQAHTTATAAARDSLAEQGLRCRETTVHVDVSGFGRPVGQPAEVTASVSCLVDLDGLAVPGMPGTRLLEATSVSVLDRYRSR